jgi:hypothetical protein
LYQPLAEKGRDTMRDQGREELDLRTATGQEIEQAMTRGVKAALREHKRAGNPVAIWDRENDRVILVPPEEIVLPDEEDVTDAAVAIEDRS